MVRKIACTLGASLAFCVSHSAPVLADSEPYIGDVMMVSFNYCPRGWAKLDGQLMPITTNKALYSVIGATYGGDGETTFALPDMQGRGPVHTGIGIALAQREMGDRFGRQTGSLATTNLPAHSHETLSLAVSTLNASNSAADTSLPKGAKLAEHAPVNVVFEMLSPATDGLETGHVKVDPFAAPAGSTELASIPKDPLAIDLDKDVADPATKADPLAQTPTLVDAGDADPDAKDLTVVDPTAKPAETGVISADPDLNVTDAKDPVVADDVDKSDVDVVADPDPVVDAKDPIAADADIIKDPVTTDAKDPALVTDTAKPDALAPVAADADAAVDASDPVAADADLTKDPVDAGDPVTVDADVAKDPVASGDADDPTNKPMVMIKDNGDFPDPNPVVTAPMPVTAYAANADLDVALVMGSVQTEVKTQLDRIGGGLVFNVQQPSLGVTFCMALYGAYPPTHR